MKDNFSESESIKREIELRGRYIMMGCDLEFSLLCIIMYCSPDPNNQKRLGQFTEMKLNEKINNAICDLKAFNNDYYLEFKDQFDVLDEFRIIRNDMAHCIGRFKDNVSFDTFIIDYIDKEDRKDKLNKNEWFKYKEYTQDYISTSIIRFKEVNGRLFDLWSRLKSNYEASLKSPPLIRPKTDI